MACFLQTFFKRRLVMQLLFNKIQEGIRWLGIVFFLVLWLMESLSLAAYSPPTGIPAPPFGIDEISYDWNSHCPNWPYKENSIKKGSTFDCYYIDNENPKATDNNNLFGYPEKPRKTLPEGVLSAGAYIEVHGGITEPYLANGDRFDWSGVGSKENYILISGKNAKAPPKLAEMVHIGAKGKTSYLIFENFEIQTEKYALEVRPGVDGKNLDHISVRNCIMHGNGKFKSAQSFVATSYPSTPNASVSYVVFYNNESFDAGDWNAIDEDDTSSFHMGDNAHYVWVLNNIAYRSGGDGASGAHGANRNSDHYYIGRNIFYNHRENAIDIKEINHVIISENVCFDFKSINSANGEAIVVHYGKHDLGPNEVWLINNKIFNSDIGIQVNTTKGKAYILSNIIYNTKKYAILAYNMQSVDIINNTIVKYNTGIKLDRIANNDSYSVYGNIIGYRNFDAGYEVFVPSNAKNVKMDYNLFYNPNSKVAIGWNSLKQNTLASIEMYFDVCQHCFESDPQLVDFNSFYLSPESPCRNKNIEHQDYNLFQQYYGINIKRDFYHTSRPQGSAWDIGAIEFNSNNNVKSGSHPKPPKNLEATRS